MANEAVILELSGQNPIRFSCGTATNISKGTLLIISGDYSVVASVADGGSPVAGVAAADKVAADGESSIAVYVPGQSNIFDMKNDAMNLSVGNLVSLSGVNTIKLATEAEVVTGHVIGKLTETIAAAEVGRVLV